MDDVLPKPFTRKSLLEMLEKHLVHLKRNPQGIEPGPPSATTAPSMTHSAAQSLKDDSSPANSPSAHGSLQNWQSPNHFAHTSLNPNNMLQPGQQPQNHYVQAMQATSQPGQNFLDSSLAYAHGIGAQRPNQVPSPGHRRQISDVNNSPMGDMSQYNGAKRQRMFGGQGIHQPGRSG